MTVHVTRTDNIAADTNDRRSIWRLLNSSTVPGLDTASASVISYQQRPPDAQLGGTHDFAEFYYVISGEGVVASTGTISPIRAGDAFIIEAGTAHSIWSTSTEPVTTFYVGLRGR
ncbi:cupin domain-containing protein [Actinopolymorpha sp. B17G11]|uniref:cupin domain-containing protein n=1 Tax=unclassified Actinopolymorpha TaxID=2627063 RepID=UPI0032D97DE9